MGLLDRLLGKKCLPPPDDFAVRLVRTICCFMDASMLLVEASALVDTSQKRAIVYGYAFGALDVVAQRNNGDDITALASAAIFFMEYFKMSPEDAGRTTRLCMDMANDPHREACIREGGRAILDWASKRDENAPLRLFELLNGHTTNEHT